MIHENALFTIANFILLAAYPAILLFVIYYMRSPWRTTLPGKAVMILILSMALLMTILLLGVIFGPDHPGRGLLRLIGYGALTAAMWGLFIVLLKVRHARIELEHQAQSKRSSGSM